MSSSGIHTWFVLHNVLTTQSSRLTRPVNLLAFSFVAPPPLTSGVDI
jgi:hypothetical protein